MSFDLYFVTPPGPGEGWSDVMDRLEVAAEEEPPKSPEDQALWDRIVAAVSPIVPEGDVFERERSREFGDGSGLQLSMYPGEISLTVPYWYEGDQATQVVERLKVIAAAIEEASGLVAYDPQADAAFLESGAATAPATFDRVHDFMENELGSRSDSPPRRPWWAFWRSGER